MKRILFIGDNSFLFGKIYEVLLSLNLGKRCSFSFACSPGKLSLMQSTRIPEISEIRIKDSIQDLITKYDLIFSIHCKQIFPKALVESVKCVNIHPGYNPHNRGCYSQVFSIMNKLPIGVTIHEMDEFIDHGPIIDQKEIEVLEKDTSETLYNKLLKTEFDLFKINISSIISGSYKTFVPEEGNINYLSDFEELCKLDLDEVASFREFVNRLRALSFGDYKNLFFIDSNGNKIFVKIILRKE